MREYIDAFTDRGRQTDNIVDCGLAMEHTDEVRESHFTSVQALFNVCTPISCMITINLLKHGAKHVEQLPSVAMGLKISSKSRLSFLKGLC